VRLASSWRSATGFIQNPEEGLDMATKKKAKKAPAKKKAAAKKKKK
jgi:hypothetical protein